MLRGGGVVSARKVAVAVEGWEEAYMAVQEK